MHTFSYTIGLRRMVENLGGASLPDTTDNIARIIESTGQVRGIIKEARPVPKRGFGIIARFAIDGAEQFTFERVYRPQATLAEIHADIWGAALDKMDN